ncbi:MAG: hypothetical protein WCG14_00245 [Chlamydiia bacterium]
MEDPTFSLLTGEGTAVFARDWITQVLQMIVLTGFFCLSLIAYAWIGNVGDLLSFIKIKKRITQDLV